MEPLQRVVADARACRYCEPELPLGANPVLRAQESARLLIIGQAPGTKVHNTGVPWNDASGERLRFWLQVDSDTFYDSSRIAIVPMGFCYPGRDTRGGDKPPRPECAPMWHPRLLAALPNLELTLLVGSYAQKHYLAKTRRRTLWETVANYRDYLPDYVPLPHPSWRNTAWLKKNPWFERDLLPDLRARVHALL
ncbi:uracil-DNA glycosylase [Rhodovibrio salinarum]|uniref:Uracil-DNA glycosylase n=1 Tax=Rhodovibrio salinarum TaxID=1087 RepID=A0A934QGR5_9PROT|nr:uracil-DNA glycosylase [Rhodovibrio salinarum]